MYRVFLFFVLFVCGQIIAIGQTEYGTVEDMPVFPGCENENGKQAIQDCSSSSIFQYVIDNTVYPKDVPGQNIQGSVYLTFVIDSVGNTTKVRVVKAMSNELFNQEAVRVVSSMPKMTPGRKEGVPTAVQYTIPVKFRPKKSKNVIIDKGVDLTKKMVRDFKGRELPSFKGGQIYQYISRSLNYPAEAIEACASGVVYIEFWLDKNGNVDTVRIKHSLHSLLEKEALRVLHSTSGKWSIDVKNMIALDLSFILPFKFDIKGGCTTASSHYDAAMKQFMKGKYRKAVSGFRSSLKYDALNADALYNCGISYMKLNEDDSACYYLNMVKHREYAKSITEFLCK